MAPRNVLIFTLFVFPLLVTSVAFADYGGRLHGNIMRPPGIPAIAPPPEKPVISRNGTTLPPYSTVYHFDQLVDHNDPSKGTFKQRFFHTWEYYEPGGPVVVSTPGEINADGYYTYLTNTTLNGLLAQQQNGSTIVIEHRFYGLSNPRPDLTVESLKLHTLQQAIDDLVYFANNVILPMPGGDQLTPDKAPWILMGGSYAGALTAWTMDNKPGVFYAGYSSSGVVQAVYDFWQYFEPIREHMPKNCSADVQAVIAHVDHVFTGKNQSAINNLKDSLGMGELTHLDDVAGALRNNLWDWQKQQVTTGPGSLFYKFCDALEVKDGKNAPASGWGLAHALDAWGSYLRNSYLNELCGDQSILVCLGTYDPTLPFWTNTTIDNTNRSWLWIVCNEVGYFQEAAPFGHPSLVSRLIQPEYDLRQCKQMFPEAFPEEPTTINTERTNHRYKGWHIKVDRLFFANGYRDPWRDATMSAEGQYIQSTPMQPIAISNGFHTSDLKTASNIDPTIRAVQTQALAFMKTWLSMWKPGQVVSQPSSHRLPSVDVGVSAGFSPLPAIGPSRAWIKSSGD